MASNKDFEKRIEEKVESKFQLLKASKVIGEMIGYGIFLFVLFYVLPRANFITDKYPSWQMIAFWTTTAGTLMKVVKHVINVNFLKGLLEIGSLLLSIYSTYMLLVIYPLDLSELGLPQISNYFPLALQVALLAMFLAIFVNIIKMVFSKVD